MSGTNFGLTGDSGADPYADTYGSTTSQVDAATSLGQGWSFDTPKTADTATGNAVQSMAPVTAPNTTSGSNSSGFWSAIGGALGGAVNTASAVIAKNNGIPQPGSATPVPVPPPNRSGLVMLLGAGLVVYLLVTHKGA